MAFQPDRPLASGILPEPYNDCPRTLQKPEFTPLSYPDTDEAKQLAAWFENRALYYADTSRTRDEAEFAPIFERLAEEGRDTGKSFAALCAYRIGSGACGAYWCDPVTATIEQRDVDCEIREV